MARRKSEWLSKAEFEYGATHGLPGHFFVKGGMPEPEIAKPLEPLGATDKAKLKVHIDNLKKHMPEVVDFAKELIAEGMMPQRNIRVRVHAK